MSGLGWSFNRRWKRITSEHTRENDSYIVHQVSSTVFVKFVPSRVRNRASLVSGECYRDQSMVFSHLCQGESKRSQRRRGDTRRPWLFFTLYVPVRKVRGHKSHGALKVTQHPSFPHRFNVHRSTSTSRGGLLWVWLLWSGKTPGSCSVH